MSGGVSLGRDDGLSVTLKDVNGLYILQMCVVWKSVRALAAQDGEEDEEKASKQVALWHLRLGYLEADAVRRLSMEDNAIPGLLVVLCCVCMGCIYRKIVCKSFSSLSLSLRATQPLEIIYSDITGLVTPKSLVRALYLLIFMDDFTRFKIGYLIKHKSEALMYFIDYKVLAENHHGKPVCKLGTHGGGEYTSNEFSNLFRQEGIEAQRTMLYTLQLNGLSEQANRTIIGTR